MFGRITLVLVLLVGRAAWSQVQPDASGGVDAPDYDSQLMLTPPPVSGQAYPNTIGLETTTNYLSASLAVNGGYVQNVLPSQTATPVNDATFAIFPTFEIARSRPHRQVTFTYSPSFLFYQPTSSLDTVDQGAALMFQDRLNREWPLACRMTFSDPPMFLTSPIYFLRERSAALRKPRQQP